MQPTDGMTNPTVRILVVDHKDAQREAIASALRGLGHEVITAESGDGALERLRLQPIDVMLCEARLPDMSGLDLMDTLPDAAPGSELVVVMLTEQTATDTASACVQRGAVDYLTTPLTADELGNAVVRALKARAERERDRAVASRRGGTSRTEREPAGDAPQRERVVLPTLDALVAALEAKSVYLAGHSARVAAFAATIAHHLSLEDDAVEEVRMAGRLHDLGMIGVKDQVIDKHGKLTPQEYAHVRGHVGIGVRILTPLTYLGRALVDSVRTHHERWDGQGYPKGLSGEQIPLGGRILGACEVFDALTTRRPYRDRVRPEIALDRMRTLAGSVVDPMVVEALTSAVKHRTALTFLE